MENQPDVIEQLLQAAGVPPVMRQQVRAQIMAQLNEHDAANFQIALGGPQSPLPFHQQPQVAPGSPAEQQLMQQVKNAIGEEPPEDTARHAYGMDLDLLRITFKAITDLATANDLEPHERTLLEKLRSMRKLLTQSLVDQVDSYIASKQRENHEDKQAEAKMEFQRWQRDIFDGRTILGFEAWKAAQEGR